VSEIERLREADTTQREEIARLRALDGQSFRRITTLMALLQEAGEAIDSLIDHYESCEAAIFEQQFGELNPKAKALLARIKAVTGEAQ